MEESEEQIIDDEPMLATLQQIEVPFLDALILALLGADGDIYVPMTPFATRLGIGNPRNQVARVKRDDTMTEGLRKMTVDTVGGPQEQQCIRLDMFTIWLITITEKVCKEEIRPTLSQYKREAARAILRHFREKALLTIALPASPIAIPATTAPPEEWVTYHQAMAAMYTELARQRAMIAEHQQRLERHEDEIAARLQCSIRCRQGV